MESISFWPLSRMRLLWPCSNACPELCHSVTR
ncbi:uncharacterized protein HMPREF1541_00332 [Cyphellophora europaea CBS 101466]|uniref:Uncharacterized protein n=1 Tax=Cyphellophora europaea (strain CBS 101466) TaxID=1220924 RepID=W2SDN3_CYPE1|nr:uncharacterized protein HMPREF1541_00332 [Cyphellophora europaea CBS 101466]ETN46148.1 hypothetical protein HMPREF1541_00332 [Cyphellophora europaea CBS 101466]